MITLNIRQARARISRLLDCVAGGEEVVITRHGKPAAKLVAPLESAPAFPDRQHLRQSLPPMPENAGAAVRALREEERY